MCLVLRHVMHPPGLPTLRHAIVRRAFTLVELLVVMAIIGILVALLVPAVSGARESSRRTHCSANLRQLSLALQQYHDLCGHFPPGCVEPKKRRIAWSAFILPYIEQKELYAQFRFDLRARSTENQPVAGTEVVTFLCPSTGRLGVGRVGNRSGDINRNGRYDPGEQMAMTDYGGIFGIPESDPERFMNGVMIWDRPVRMAEIVDGMSYTLIVGEDSGRGPTMDGEWANGENIFDQAGEINQQQDNELWSDHPSGVNVALCDGSARFLSHTLSRQVLGALCTRAMQDYVPGEGF